MMAGPSQRESSQHLVAGTGGRNSQRRLRLGIGKAFGVPETVRQEPRFDGAILRGRARCVGPSGVRDRRTKASRMSAGDTELLPRSPDGRPSERQEGSGDEVTGSPTESLWGDGGRGRGGRLLAAGLAGEPAQLAVRRADAALGATRKPSRLRPPAVASVDVVSLRAPFVQSASSFPPRGARFSRCYAFLAGNCFLARRSGRPGVGEPGPPSRPHTCR